MNDLKTIRQLIKMMVDNDLTEIDLEGEGEKIKLKRGHQASAGSAVQYLPAPPATPAQAPAPAAGDASHSDDDHTSGNGSDEGTITIDSPMVGTFYTASSPDADAFVDAGDTVKPDTVVCIVEAMKVFNEIKAEVSGKITEVLVKNGDAVEFGQPIYRVRP